MTHEEIFTAIARDELRSYRQLPQVWYQIQTKFRDEPRPKSGLLRVRQFTMKDAYSFDVDAAGLDKSYDDQRRAYERIFTRCGLDFVAVQAHSGAMGGSGSQEFMVRTDAGEDDVAACPKCRYAANTETARSRGRSGPVDAGERLDAPRKFPTPGVRTIEALERPPYGRSGRPPAEDAGLRRPTRSSCWPSSAATTSSTRPSCRPPPARPRCAPPTRRRSARCSAPTPGRWARWA